MELKVIKRILSFFLCFGLVVTFFGVNGMVAYAAPTPVSLVQDASRSNNDAAGKAIITGEMPINYTANEADGTSSTIVNYVGNIVAFGDQMESALKFTLPATSSVLSSAKLHLRVINVKNSPTATVTLTDDNSWGQTDVPSTSTYPSLSNPTTLLSNQPINTSGVVALSLDTTELAAKISSGGTSDITLIVTGSTTADNYFNFVADDDASTDQAYLELAFKPQVQSVSVPSNGTYKSGDALNFTVTFDEAVTVTGTPRIPVTLNTGGTVYASYVSGSNSKNLVFRYTVASGNLDADGITLGSAINLNSGTIKNSNEDDAELNLYNIAATTSLLVDGIAPSISGVSPPIDATYNIGDNLDYTVNFSEHVNVVTTGGTPYLTLTVGSSTVHAAYYSGTGSSALTFRYTVASGDTDADGVALASNVTLNSGTIEDAAGNSATLTFTGGTAAGVLVSSAPTVTDANISISGGTGTGGAYKIGDTVTATWNNTAGGDNNSATITGVTVDFSQFGGGAAVAATNNSGAWTATYTIIAGAMDATNRNVSFTVTDNAGNATTTADTTNATVDSLEPTVSISSTASTITNTSPIVVTITFSESVTSFDAGDITVVNGTAGNFVAVSGTTYTADITPSGQGAVTVDVAANVAQDDAGNNNTAATQLSRIYASTAPTVTITSTAPSCTNISPIPVTITFSESVTDFVVGDITVGNGTAGNFIAVSGSVYTANITPSGQGAVTVDVATNVAQDAAGNNNTAATQLSKAYDTTAPTLTSGTITVSDLTSSSAKLTWSAASDTTTTAANLQYKAVCSTSAISSIAAADALPGTWTSNITTSTVTGLTASTDYQFYVLVKDEAGNKTLYTAATGKTTATTTGGGSSGGGSSNTGANSGSTSGSNSGSTSGSTVVEVNGEKQDAGTTNTQTTGGQTVTTIKVDDTKLDKVLESKGEKPTITLPTGSNSDVTIGELNGQTVKNMEQKEAILEIKTPTISYTLPASQIKIDDVSAQIGTKVELKDIKVSVKIAEPSADTVKIVENTANKNNYQIVVKPIEFEITCTSGNKTVDVSKFNGYVERTVAIPDGVDPSKITTGIVLNSDGTFSHVPTQIVVIKGKYYAKINSLTNSTYSVIWNPVTFTDVANHWSKNTVNDMASRMIVTGTGNGTYEPDRSINRAEFAAITVRAMGLQKGTMESNFGDVMLTDWFNGYVDSATAYSLITGYDSKSYRPSDMITREQAMAILDRAMKLTGLNTSLSDSEKSTILSKYTDASSVSDYAKTSVAVCIKTGVVTGSTATTLSPKGYVTRAEVAVMVQRLLQKSGLI